MTNFVFFNKKTDGGKIGFNIDEIGVIGTHRGETILQTRKGRLVEIEQDLQLVIASIQMCDGALVVEVNSHA